jgi:hypothetical protein
MSDQLQAVGLPRPKNSQQQQQRPSNQQSTGNPGGGQQQQQPQQMRRIPGQQQQKPVQRTPAGPPSPNPGQQRIRIGANMNRQVIVQRIVSARSRPRAPVPEEAPPAPDAGTIIGLVGAAFAKGGRDGVIAGYEKGMKDGFEKGYLEGLEAGFKLGVIDTVMKIAL